MTIIDMKCIGFLTAFLTLVVIPHSAQAQICNQGGYDIERATLARVKPGGRIVYIHGAEIDGCPSLGERCREKAYLVAGDIVVLPDPAAGAPEGLVCADFTSSTGQAHFNWIARTAIEPMPTRPGMFDGWVGEWRRPESTIRIRGSTIPGTLALAGAATYGANDPARVARGSINTGSIAAVITPRNDRAEFGMVDGGSKGAKNSPDLYGNLEAYIPFAAIRPGDCGVRLRLMGPVLMVTDNNDCGGINVSFTGVYVRTRLGQREANPAKR